jgi:HD-like signal output (HDOD) protein/DNA-binding response OmpR family regulator
MHSVLIVDGCPLTRECLSILLRAKGYKAFTAADGAQAKAHIAKRPPDVMICELVLPDGSALGLLRWMVQEQGKGQRTRVCVLTQVAAKKPLTDAVEIGVSAVMLKPRFTMQGLLTQLDDVLNRGNGADAAAKTESEPVRFPLPMPASDPALDLRQRKPLLNRPQLESNLEQCEPLTASGAVVAKLQSMIEAGNAEFEVLGDVLRGDPVLVSAVLREANATEHGCEEPTSGVFEALLRIGLDRLVAILQETPSGDAPVYTHESGMTINIDQMRAHAFGVGLIATRIASLVEGVNAKSAMTAGLLHDYGRQRMLAAMSGQMMETIAASSSIGVPLVMGERRLLLSEHNQLGQSMMNVWNLPRELTEAVAYHHEDPPKIATTCPRNTKLVATVALADRIAHAMGLGGSGTCAIETSEDLMNYFAEDELKLDPILSGMREELEGALKNSGIPADAITWPSNVSNPDHPVRPVFLTADPDHDLIGHWLHQQFGELAEGEFPNVAIIHMRQAKSRTDLGNAFQDVVNKLVVQGQRQALPVLILSPTGRNGLNEELMTRHPCMHLRTPFTVSNFDLACSSLLSGQVMSGLGTGAAAA